MQKGLPYQQRLDSLPQVPPAEHLLDESRPPIDEDLEHVLPYLLDLQKALPQCGGDLLDKRPLLEPLEHKVQLHEAAETFPDYEALQVLLDLHCGALHPHCLLLERHALHLYSHVVVPLATLSVAGGAGLLVDLSLDLLEGLAFEVIDHPPVEYLV